MRLLRCVYFAMGLHRRDCLSESKKGNAKECSEIIDGIAFAPDFGIILCAARQKRSLLNLRSSTHKRAI